MADKFTELSPKHTAFITEQHLFFVATASSDGRINLSPKGMDTLKIINPTRVIWLNLTGSGNETSVHVQEDGRMTIMFCSFDKNPLILRLYGTAKVIHSHDDEWEEMQQHFDSFTGSRQVFILDIDLVMTSCGFGIPFYEYSGERDTLTTWADKRGREGIETYWEEKNQISLDGKETKILKPS